jgi:hypothetical protein
MWYVQTIIEKLIISIVKKADMLVILTNACLAE